MRNIALLFMAVIFGTSASFANTADDKVAERNTYRYDNSFIFLEEGITFAVYPDGEFDFYIDNQVTGRRDNVTFNSGFDYSPYAQYDDYGAVIQVENIPIYYDYYGRVSQVGSVDVNYRNGRVNRLGNMNVFYNNRGFYDYHTGYINIYNRRYIYRPFHRFFARPAIGFSFVRTSPYRRYYNPFRYTYYNPYRFNRRNTYARIGKVHRYNQARRQRANVYRNDKRVAVRQNRIRNNRTAARSNVNRSTNGRTVANNSRNVNRVQQGRTNSSNVRSTRNVSTNRSTTVNRNRSTNGRSVKNSTTRTPQRSTTTKRTVTQTPRSRTVTRSTTQNNRSQARSSQRTVQRTPARSSNVKSRSTSSRSVAKAPSRSNTVKSRSTSSRSVAKAPSRSRNTATRSTSSRSSRNNSATTSRSRARQ